MEKELQCKYNAWRMEYEEQKQEQGKKCFQECCFADARKSFSEYAGMQEIISYDAMWKLEHEYCR